MYAIIKSLLFLLPPEPAHKVTTALLDLMIRVPFIRRLFARRYQVNHPQLKRELLGLTFSNPVGLAAGFDKNAQHLEAFEAMGFGFLEVGTVTPKPQPGNEKPRLFRLPKDEALINRMGFNNAGVEAMTKRLASRKTQVIIGGNIGKNKWTSNEDAPTDYLLGFHALYPHVDYFAVNVSSPNTPDLRRLQEKEPLRHLLKVLLNARSLQAHYRPILLKIAPDLAPSALNDILEIVEELKLDGLIAINTTIFREGLKTNHDQVRLMGAGGLSGAPIKDVSTDMVKHIRQRLPEIPIIAAGGISSPADVKQKLDAGADLVQLYTGLVYKGPELIRDINRSLISG